MKFFKCTITKPVKPKEVKKIEKCVEVVKVVKCPPPPKYHDACKPTKCDPYKGYKTFDA